jgi:hypothetical protein
MSKAPTMIILPPEMFATVSQKIKDQWPWRLKEETTLTVEVNFKNRDQAIAALKKFSDVVRRTTSNKK